MNLMAQNQNHALKIASFDGGGLRSFSQLKMMQLFMHRQNVILPCEYFDMIGGSDTGGLIAIMLAKLRMSVKDTIGAFATIVLEVYREDLSKEQRTSTLRMCMEELLNKRGFLKTQKLEDENENDHRVGYASHDRCAGFVIAALCLNVRTRVCFRTYPVKTEMPSEITVIDAALATCALQPKFLPLEHGAPYDKQEYIGAGLGDNNPTRQVIRELRSYFKGDPTVSLLLSLGTGHPGIFALDNDDGLFRLMQDIMEDSEKEAQDVQQQLAHIPSYFRFSVEQGMQKIYDRTRALNWISAQTDAYLKLPEIVTRFNRLFSVVGSTSLTDLESCLSKTPGQGELRHVEVQETTATTPLLHQEMPENLSSKDAHPPIDTEEEQSISEVQAYYVSPSMPTPISPEACTTKNADQGEVSAVPITGNNRQPATTSHQEIPGNHRAKDARPLTAPLSTVERCDASPSMPTPTSLEVSPTGNHSTNNMPSPEMEGQTPVSKVRASQSEGKSLHSGPREGNLSEGNSESNSLRSPAMNCLGALMWIMHLS